MTVLTANGPGTRGLRAPRRVWAAVLAVSVALNLCFVAGALWTRFNPAPTPATASERFRKLEANLDLTAGQRVTYQAYVTRTRERIARLRQEIDPLLDAAWSEIAKPQPDDAYLMQRFDEAAAQWRAYQHEAVDSTLALLAHLTPEQRAKFVANELERRALARRRRLEESR
jgi:Spy/CpxP family protein refolding chaperone